MAAPPRIVVRRAEEADYAAVMDITKEFALGADYLFEKYNELVSDPDSTYYVCEVDGEVAAFEGVSLLDDNNTLMTRSARVKDKFRGQGLLNEIRKKIYEDYKDVSGQKRIRSCCANIVRLVDSATFRSQNKLIGRRAFTLYDPLGAFQVPSAYIDTIPEVRTIDAENLSILFQNKEMTRYLFPMGFLEVISWFFDPLVSNIRHIQKQHPHIIITSALHRSMKHLNYISNTEKSDFDSGENETNDHPCGLLAIYTHFNTPTMLYFNIDIYGKPRHGQEDSELRPVIFHGLKHVISVMERDQSGLPLALGLSTDDDELLKVCKNIVELLGFHQDKMGVFKSQNFFEQEFERLVN